MRGKTLCYNTDSVRFSEKLSCNNTHFASFWYHFENICNVMYYFDVDKSEITIQPSRNKNCVTVPFSLKNIGYISFFGLRNLIAFEEIFMFFLPKFGLLLFLPIESQKS